jgi:type II secretion system protein G
MTEIIWVDAPPTNEACIKTLMDLRTITAALELYKSDNGKYPNNEVGINALIMKNKNDKYYLYKLITDGWGKPYIYKYPSTLNTEYKFDLYSTGENQVDDRGKDDDIYLSDTFACPEPSRTSKTLSNITYSLLYIWLPLALLYLVSKLFFIYKKRKT